MDNVTFKADIQNMNMIENERYDLFICSHVLEHVEDDRKALQELKRLLKPDGLGILLVPIVYDLDKIDEEWGLSEEENWRRFGQNDHCRLYNKNGLIERLQDSGFYVHSLGKDFFGRTLFLENVLTDTSTLYIINKSEINEIFSHLSVACQYCANEAEAFEWEVSSPELARIEDWVIS